MKNLLNIIKSKQILISIDDLRDINELLNSGFSIYNALKILVNDNNERIFNNFFDNLAKGIAPKDFFPKACPLKIRQYMEAYLCYLPFKEALNLSLNIYTSQDLQYNSFFKILIYPFTLLSISLVGVYIFIIVFLPNLVKMMQVFNGDLSFVNSMSTIIVSIIHLLFIVLMIIIGIIVYFIASHNQVLGYVILCKYTKNKLFKQYLSNQFALYFKECLNSGFKTKQALDILQSIKSKPLLVFMAYHVDQALLKGTTMQRALNNNYLDQSLAKFMNIAVYSNNLGLMLEGYIKSNTLKLMRVSKRIASVIQMFSYTFIGLIIIFIYQILFLPLEVLSQM